MRNIIITLSLFLLASTTKAAIPDTTIYVSPGNDETLEDALIASREFKRLHTTADGYQFYTNNKDYPHVTISLSPGRYKLMEPLTLRPEDSYLDIIAPNGAQIVGSRQVRLQSAGMPINGRNALFAPFSSFNGIAVNPRQLWVNGSKAINSRNVEDFNKMNRILNYDKKNRILWLRGSDLSNEQIADINDNDGSMRSHILPELVLHQMWEVSVLRIDSIFRSGDSIGVTFQNPEARIQFSHPWPGPMYNSKHDSPYYIQNSWQFLDSPGEWLNINGMGIVYIPRKGETTDNTYTDIPVQENLIRVEGTPERPVTNINIKGITFSYTTWTRPSREGHVPLQAGMYLTEAYKLRPQIDRTDNHKLDNQGWLGRARAAVEVSYGRNVNFSNCEFTHLGGSGLDFIEGCKGGGIDNCKFSDIAMNGVVAGSFSPAGLETHLPYQPADKRVVCDSLTVNGSTFTDIGNEDWGCCAVTAGYVADTRITNNTIHDIPYTGISLGWGWNRTANCMHDNYVAHNRISYFAQHMTDCAGIYTLGNQPGTIIEDNTVSDAEPPAYVHDPDHWFWLYTDEGSSNITIRNNHCPSDRFLKNANGPGNVWENNVQK